MRMTKSRLGAAALLSMGLVAGAASAQSTTDTRTDDQMEVEALMSSQITLGDAVSAAESDSGGTAVSAEFTMETDDDTPVFVVEVAKSDGTTSELAVASDGTVSPYAEPDDNGHENGEDMEESDDDDT
ncbi:hypothetical protein LX81_03368 [Palleronia aestuarii]|uniref:PepSY domain-containing protein n=1 Tax=Palleronia aestuarii TaxID=568105 RepID=A0A2W7MZ83_9RHOB|nr:PepSY domain-containing protein [Palleronia aestuarii]PZX12991.1 hypothetical protein LX81_03368 [Palleronia aestuarii]